MQTFITDEQIDSLLNFTSPEMSETEINNLYLATESVDEYTNDLYTPSTKVTSERKRDYRSTPTQISLLSKYGNKSSAIRALTQEGFKTGEIANMLNIRYQHVRNVQTQVLKRK